MNMNEERIVYETRTAFGQSENIGVYALASAVNRLAAEDVNRPEISVVILRPPDGIKEHMYAIEKKVKRTCRERDICLRDIRKGMQAGVSQYTAVVTGAGLSPKKQEWYRETMRAGQDIVMAKWAGMEGMLRLAEEKKEELSRRFAPAFLRQIENVREEIFSLKEIRTAVKEGVSVIYEIGEGGIYAALWRLSEKAGTGLEADLRRIPVLQETIEVCEYLHLNPYRLASAGSLLFVTEQGEAAVQALLRDGAEAAVIGSLRDDNDKIIRNGEERRFIDRPAPDEFNYIFMEDKRNERH